MIRRIAAAALVAVFLLPAGAAAAGPPSVTPHTAAIDRAHLASGGYGHVAYSTITRDGGDTGRTINVPGPRYQDYAAGCRFTAYNAFGLVIYWVKVSQDFRVYTGPNTPKIDWRGPVRLTSSTYYGWVVTSSSSSSGWVVNPTRARANGDWNLTQYVAGQPFQSKQLDLQVNLTTSGWTCT
jgi:hypothetical protein